MKYRKDEITFAVSNVTLVEDSLGSKVSLLLTYMGNEKEFVFSSDNITALERAIKHKDYEKQQRALFRLIRKNLENPVMDWIYNASNEAMPFNLRKYLLVFLKFI